ncbi:MAG: tyrosine-type recombinase/integrase [Clostridia bacterium]
MDNDYTATRHKIYTKKIREMLKGFPPYCADYFRARESTTSVLTRFEYATDLRIFFNFLINRLPRFLNKNIESITLSDLDSITSTEIEIFIEYLSYYERNGEEFVNNESTKARKLSTIRAFFKYFYKKGQLLSTVPTFVDPPKLHDKPIVRLEPDEVARLLDACETGLGMTMHQKKLHEKAKIRDMAILTLFLGTGIRISELVGLNTDDLNFFSNEFSITRKGGNKDTLVFGSETRTALLNYIEIRESQNPLPGYEGALFLSSQMKRLTVRAVENIVKKYAAVAVPQKSISPHKLRSTYGTMLYRETGDIYLVADCLGHKDVNTTKKHYAALSQDRRRFAASVIKLRDDDEKKD